MGNVEKNVFKATDGGTLLNGDQFEWGKDELGRPVLKIKTGGGTEVTSVNGKSGVVVLTATDVGALASTTKIPAKTSDLTNDSGFITSAGVPVKSVDGATGAVTTNAVKTVGQTLTDAQKKQARANIGAGTSSFDGNYNNLSNKPTVPTKVSQLENDSKFITDAAVTVKSVNSKTGAIVLTAKDVGALADSTKIPTKISELTNDSKFITAGGAPVQSVNAKTGAVVLSATDVGALPNTTKIPTKTSELTNDSGFISSSAVKSVNEKTGAVVLTAGDVGAVPTTRTVNGHALSANVAVTKTDVGLGNVDNTSDANKPVSTATKTALDGKVPTSRKVNGKALTADITLSATDVGIPAFTAADNGKVLGVQDGKLAWITVTTA